MIYYRIMHGLRPPYLSLKRCCYQLGRRKRLQKSVCVHATPAHVSGTIPVSCRSALCRLSTPYLAIVPGLGTPKEDFASEIFPWLWLGGQKDALNYETLSRKNIRYILNTSREGGPRPSLLSATRLTVGVIVQVG